MRPPVPLAFDAHACWDGMPNFTTPRRFPVPRRVGSRVSAAPGRDSTTDTGISPVLARFVCSQTLGFQGGGGGEPAVVIPL